MIRKTVKRLGRKVCVTTLVCALSISSFMGNQTTSEAAKKGKVNKVSITKPGTKTLVVKKGKTYSLKVNVKTSKKSVSKKVTYKSSKKAIARVNKKGVVKGVKNGKATITVTSTADKKKRAKLNVVVGTPVTKVKLNKKTASVKVGGTVTLKASISPKKPSVKGVTWKTSKKKVAKVTSKGVVTGVAAGTATVTATAKDGTGKKASCKVTVTKAVANIVGLEVMDGNYLKVTLDQASALTRTDFMVAAKNYDTYRSENAPEDVKTTDNVVYMLDLKYGVSVGQTVRVTIPKLAGGVNSMECIYKQSDFITNEETLLTGTVGKSFDGYASIEGIRGSATITVSGNLPAGITFNQQESNKYGIAQFYGKPTAVADNVQVTVTATDELGNENSRVVTFIISDENTLMVWNKKLTIRAIEGYNYSVSSEIYGGSGNYSVTFDGIGTYERASHGNGNISLYSTKTMYAAGGVTATITDRENASLTKTVTFTKSVTPSVFVGGKILDSNGNPIKNAGTYFYTKEKFDLRSTYDEDSYEDGNYAAENNYMTCGSSGRFYSAKTKEDGNYMVRVPVNATVKGNFDANDGRVEEIRKFTTGTTSIWDKNSTISLSKYKKVNVSVVIPENMGIQSAVITDIYANSITSEMSKVGDGANGYIYLPIADADTYEVYAYVDLKGADGYIDSEYTKEAAVTSADTSEASVSLSFKVYTVNITYTCQEAGVQLNPSQEQLVMRTFNNSLYINEYIPAYKNNLFIGYYYANGSFNISSSSPEVLAKTISCSRYNGGKNQYFNIASPTGYSVDEFTCHIVKKNGETVTNEYDLDSYDSINLTYGTYELYFTCEVTEGGVTKSFKTTVQPIEVTNSSGTVTISANSWTVVTE